MVDDEDVDPACSFAYTTNAICQNERILHCVSVPKKLAGESCMALRLVGWLTPPLPWDGGLARTAIQVHANNLIKLG